VEQQKGLYGTDKDDTLLIDKTEGPALVAGTSAIWGRLVMKPPGRGAQLRNTSVL